MFLIFSLGRINIFPTKDLGIRKAVSKLYQLDELPNNEYMNNLGNIYSPYSTIATLTLWKYLDNRVGG